MSIYPRCDKQRWASQCSSLIVDAENYYTKEIIDQKLEEIESAITSGCCITPEEVDDKISSYTYSQEEIDEKIPSLSGYATEQWVLDKHYITGVDLSNYATEDFALTLAKDVHNEVQEVDGKVQTLSGNVRTISGDVQVAHAHLSFIDNVIGTLENGLKAHTGDTSIHFTTGAVQTQINNSISNYYTKAQTINLIESAVTVVEGEIPSLDDYVTKEELPTDIASKQWVINQNYASYSLLMQYVMNLQNQIDALREEISGCCSDTGTTLTRWVTMTGASDYTCSGTTKMTKEEEEQSVDGGNTWTPTGNYRTGSTVLEPDCIDCGYTPEPSNLKYKGDYNNTLQSKYVECDGVPSITVWEVQNDVPSTIDNLTGATFYACCEYIANNILGAAYNIERVDIKEGVLSIGQGAFKVSSALTTVIIPNSVKYIDGNAFGECPNLSALTIGSGVTEIGDGAFSGDSSISNDLNLPNVTKINTAAFQGCSSLRSVNIGSGVTRIQGSAFRGCSGLASITINATTPPSLGAMAFDDSACNIYVPQASVETYKTTYGWSTYANRILGIT